MTEHVSTLVWDGVDDHLNAQEHVRVATHEDHSPSGTRLGYDINFGPVSDSVMYLPLDNHASDRMSNYDSRRRNISHSGSIMSGVWADFNGTSSHVVIGGTVDQDDPTVLTESSSFSVSAVVRRDSVDNREVIMSKGFNSAGHWHLEARDNGRLYFFCYDGNGDPTFSTYHYGTMNAGEVYHVTLAYDDASGDATVWLNNVEETNSGFGPRPAADGISRIGVMGERDSYYFDGSMARFVYWPYAISEEENQYLYDSFESGYMVSSKKTS